MSKENVLQWLHSRRPVTKRTSLERVHALASHVGHPQKELEIIHIAGTNGKGSTVACLRSLLETSGRTVATFTSPYIETFNERFSINGQPITDDLLIDYLEKYRTIVEQLDQVPVTKDLTEFEIITVLALEYFREERVDVVLLEVGLGGLLDSTNIVSPLLTGITTIGLDHTDILGSTLSEIAHQKSGIIKEGTPLVTGNLTDEALAEVTKVAQQKNSPLYAFGQAYHVNYLHPAKNWGELFDFNNEAGTIKQLQVALVGRHQAENAAMALQLFYLYCQLKGLPFSTKEIRAALMQTRWPGRMERLSQEPLIILDGAHNEPAIQQLSENLQAEFSTYHIHVLFSTIRTKEIRSMISSLQSLPNVRLYLTTFEYPQALDLTSVSDLEDSQTTIVSLWQFGLAEILEKMSSNDLLLITGSLYFVSQVRELLLEFLDEPK